MENRTLDTANKFLVGARGNQIVVMLSPQGPISRDEAVMFAAWLLAVSTASLQDFETAYEAVCNT